MVRTRRSGKVLEFTRDDAPNKPGFTDFGADWVAIAQPFGQETKSGVRFQWNHVVDSNGNLDKDLTYYLIERTTDAGATFFAVARTSSPNASNTTIRSTEIGVLTFRIVAIDVNGQRASTATFTVTRIMFASTFEDGASWALDGGGPAVGYSEPQGASVGSAIRFQWNHIVLASGIVDPALLYYLIERSTDQGTTFNIRDKTPESAATLSSEIPGTHTYRIVAVDKNANRHETPSFIVRHYQKTGI